MKHLIFLLSNRQLLFVALVDHQLLHHLVLLIGGSNSLVLDGNSVQLALVNQPIVLVVPNLPFSTSFKLLPSLLLHHGRVGIHVLSLEADLLQLLSESLILSLLVLLLLIDLLVGLDETLLPYLPLLFLHLLLILELLLSPLVVLLLTDIPSLLNFIGRVDQFFSFLVLFPEVLLSFHFSLLLYLPLVELDPLSELSD